MSIHWPRVGVLAATAAFWLGCAWLCVGCAGIPAPVITASMGAGGPAELKKYPGIKCWDVDRSQVQCWDAAGRRVITWQEQISAQIDLELQRASTRGMISARKEL